MSFRSIFAHGLTRKFVNSPELVSLFFFSLFKLPQMYLLSLGLAYLDIKTVINKGTAAVQVRALKSKI